MVSVSSDLTGPIHTMLKPVERGDARHRVAFFHGLMGRGRNFLSIAKGLEPEAQSLLVDLPNHAQSGWTKDFDYLQLADLVAAELRRDFALNEQIDVVGHSMGGKIAMVLALRHPDLVRKLTVIDIAPQSARGGESEFKHLISSLAGLDLSAVQSRTDADEKMSEPIPQRTVRAFLLQNLQSGEGGFSWQANLDLLYQQLDNVMDFPDMSGHQFEGPVLWMRGDQSDYVQDEAMPAMRTLFPQVHLLTVKNAGHWVHSQQPAVTIEALRTFLLT